MHLLITANKPWHDALTFMTIMQPREAVGWEVFSNGVQSWQQCGPLVPVYLCSTAGPQEMHREIKDFYGATWLGNSLCV